MHEQEYTHDEKVDNALRFLAALVAPEQQWLVQSVRAEVLDLRRRIAELEEEHA